MQFTYLSYKKEIFRVSSFSEQFAAKGNSLGATWKIEFICTSLKQTLSSGQKPVCIVKILISEQIAFAAVPSLDKFLFSTG